MTVVAKPLCPQDNNGFRGKRAGVENDSERSQHSERTGLEVTPGYKRGLRHEKN